MAMYRVSWEIDVEADSHRHAAEKALEIQRRPDGTATVFEVRPHDAPSARPVTFDLDEDPEPPTGPGQEPRFYAWIVPGRVAVAERPGRGGRSHRRALREQEEAWWRAQGVTGIVSAMRTRHGLVEYALAGLAVRWHPLTEPAQARAEMPRLVKAVREMLEDTDGAILIHADRPGEWLTGIDACIRLSAGLASDPAEALTQAAADGLPVGPLAAALANYPRT